MTFALNHKTGQNIQREGEGCVYLYALLPHCMLIEITSCDLGVSTCFNYTDMSSLCPSPNTT